MDYVAAIKRPFTNIKKLIIGILLSILPIVNFMAFGYFVECIKLSLKNKHDLPEWKNFKILFVNGFKIFVIGAIYQLLGFILLFIVLFKALLQETVLQEISTFFQGGITNLDLFRGTFFSYLLLSPLFYVGVVLYLIGSILGLVAIVSFVKNNSFFAAFDLKNIFKKAFTIKFIIAYIVGSLINLALLYIFSFIPFVGGAIGMFIGGTTLYTIITMAYREL